MTGSTETYIEKKTIPEILNSLKYDCASLKSARDKNSNYKDICQLLGKANNWKNRKWVYMRIRRHYAYFKNDQNSFIRIPFSFYI